MFSLYTTLKMKNVMKSASAINLVTTENMDYFHYKSKETTYHALDTTHTLSYQQEEMIHSL